MAPALVLVLSLLVVQLAPAQTRSVDPAIEDIVQSISADRIAANMRKLESFQTRNTFSEPKDPALGIQAARRWLLEEFKMTVRGFRSGWTLTRSRNTAIYSSGTQTSSTSSRYFRESATPAGKFW